MVTIINYGMGNLFSVLKAFKRINVPAIITSSPETIAKADKLVLPGVGHFKIAMQNLYKLGIVDILHEKVLVEKRPILGICLGMQLFMQHSEEGDADGLGWIKGLTLKFNFDSKKHRIPHMGWNTITISKKDSFYNGINEAEDLFYFVHSYYVSCDNKEDVLTNTLYEHQFVSSLQKENITATQFHPEKSHKRGLQLLKNFSEI